MLAMQSLVGGEGGDTYFDHVRNKFPFFYDTESKRFSRRFIAFTLANDHPLEDRCVKQDPVGLMSAHDETSSSMNLVSVVVGWSCNNVELEIALAAFFPDFVLECV